MQGINPPKGWKMFAKEFADAANPHGFIENAITISDDPIATSHFHAALTGLAELDTSNSGIVFAEAINNIPGSPTAVDRIGDRVDQYESDLFTTVAQAQQYANTQLRIAALEEYTMSFESLLLPWLEASDIVEIVEERASDYTPRRFLLSNFTFPLGLGTMSGTARRVTVVGTKQTLESY